MKHIRNTIGIKTHRIKELNQNNNTNKVGSGTAYTNLRMKSQLEDNLKVWGNKNVLT